MLIFVVHTLVEVIVLNFKHAYNYLYPYIHILIVINKYCNYDRW